MRGARAERARERWESMSEAEQAERVAAMQEGRRRARSPEALAQVEQQMDELNAEFHALPRGDARRAEIIRELQVVGRRWASLAYGRVA